MLHVNCFCILVRTVCYSALISFHLHVQSIYVLSKKKQPENQASDSVYTCICTYTLHFIRPIYSLLNCCPVNDAVLNYRVTLKKIRQRTQTVHTYLLFLQTIVVNAIVQSPNLCVMFDLTISMPKFYSPQHALCNFSVQVTKRRVKLSKILKQVCETLLFLHKIQYYYSSQYMFTDQQSRMTQEQQRFKSYNKQWRLCKYYNCTLKKRRKVTAGNTYVK